VGTALRTPCHQATDRPRLRSFACLLCLATAVWPVSDRANAEYSDGDAAEQITPSQPPTAGLETAADGARDDSVPGIATGLDELEREIGLRLSFAYTMLFQMPSDSGAAGTAGAGDVDFGARWNLLGRGTENPGTLVFSSEYRFEMADRTPASLGAAIGTGVATTNGFSERPLVVKELYWIQHLADGVFRWGIGRVDPENLVGGHKLQSANLYFLNKAFSGNPAIAFPGAGIGAAMGFRPNEDWYLSAGATNAYGEVTRIEIDSLIDEWKLFSFVEAGLTPTFEGLGQGRYRIALWHIDARSGSDANASKPDDLGVSLIADQEIGSRWRLFGRYAWSEGDITGLNFLFEAGGTCADLLGERSLTGCAAAILDYAERSRGSEVVLEAFQRWQLCSVSQFTVGAQVILSPADRPETDAIAVLSARLRVSF
jgi:porin